MTRRLGILILFGALLAVDPATALAQGTEKLGWQGWGIRVGASADADQIYGGVHFNLGEFARDVRFRPTVEIGFGDDRTLVQALAEVHYLFSKVQPWRPYVGGGVGLAYVNSDDDRDDGSDTALSLAAVGGVETQLKSGTGLMFELKLGLADHDPDVKFAVGWSFN